jgi:hypothetical protein
VAVAAMVAAGAQAMPSAQTDGSVSAAAKGGTSGKPSTSKSTKVKSNTNKSPKRPKTPVTITVTQGFEDAQLPRGVYGERLSLVSAPVASGKSALLVEGRGVTLAGIPDNWYDVTAKVRLPAQQPAALLAWGRDFGTSVNANGWTTVSGHLRTVNGMLTLSFDTLCPSVQPSPWGFVVDDIVLTTAQDQKSRSQTKRPCASTTKRSSSARSFGFDSDAEQAAWAPDSRGVTTSLASPGQDGSGSALKVDVASGMGGVMLRGLAPGLYQITGSVRSGSPVSIVTESGLRRTGGLVTRTDTWMSFQWLVFAYKDGSVSIKAFPCAGTGPVSFLLDNLSIKKARGDFRPTEGVLCPAPSTTTTPAPTTTTPTTTTPVPTTTSPVPSTTSPSTTSPVPTTTTPVPTTTTPVPTTTTPPAGGATPTPSTTSPVPTTSVPSTTSPVPTTSIPSTTSPVPTTSIPSTTSPSTTSPVPTTSVPSTTSPSTTSPVPTTSSPTPTPTTPTTSTCKAKYVLLSATENGFEGELILTHATDLLGWKVDFDFVGGQQLTTMYGYQGVQEGATVTVVDPDEYEVASYEPLSIAFAGTGDAVSSRPLNIMLNGEFCS